MIRAADVKTPPRAWKHWAPPVLGVVGLIVAATALRALVHPWFGPRAPFLFYLPVVLGAAWVWGYRAGILALVLTEIAANFFLAPKLRFTLPSGDDWFTLGVFLPIGAFLIFAAEVARRARSQSDAGRETLDQALRAANMGYWDWEVRSGRVRWSDNFEAIHGLSKGAFGSTFEGFLSRIDPEDAPRVKAALERGRRDGIGYDVEYRVPTSSGQVEWMQGQGHPVVERGRVVRLTGLATNLTGRREAEEASRYLAAIVASSEDAIISKDLTGRILSWNAAAERLFGYQAEEVVGKSIELLMAPDRTDDYLGLLKRIERGERVEHYETVRRRKDGSLVEVVLTVSPVLDETGNIVAASKIARDLTAWREIEQERQRTRDLLLGTLGHDLRNPLNTITASLFFLQRHAPDSLQRVVERMTTSTERMARMIEQLLDFTRARLGGGFALERSANDLRKICAAVVEEFDAQYPDRLQLLAEGDFAGHWDSDRLSRVFSNLIANAFDYGSPDCPIVVSLSRSGDEVEVAVRNRGNGITEPMRTQIFEPFQRGPESRRRARGVGLGLYISREIVRSHGGAIDVEADGEEVVFTVKLPLQEAAR